VRPATASTPKIVGTLACTPSSAAAIVRPLQQILVLSLDTAGTMDFIAPNQTAALLGAFRSETQDFAPSLLRCSTSEPKLSNSFGK
jgi:hypothetical protein